MCHLMGMVYMLFPCYCSDHFMSPDFEYELPFFQTYHENHLAEPLTLTPEMMHFVNRYVDADWGPRKKRNRLIQAVFRKQHLGFHYDNNRTRNAREAFEDGRGNCVSLSLMFVALARHAGLRARFQEAIPIDGITSVPVTNSRIHMNVVIGRDNEVDFDPNYMKQQFRRRFLSDEEALAHFYNNIGVEFLKAGRTESALNSAQKALACNPSLAAAWNTIGICFKRQEQYHLARQAYQTALEKDPSLIQARANWAAMAFDQGHPDVAATLYAEIRTKSQNPYSLFNRAMKRTHRGDLEGAQKFLLKAVNLNPSHSGFYVGLAEVARRLHRPAEARAYFSQAESRVTTSWDQVRIRTRAPVFNTVHVARKRPGPK